MRIILLRHARTLWNVTGQMQGHKGTSIDDHGHAQSREVATTLHREHPNITLVMMLQMELMHSQDTLTI